MKKINLAIFIIASIACCYSQQIRKKIGDNPTIITPSAVLEVQSTNKGVLLPRVALTSTQDITTIASPQLSLLVYNTATSGVYPNNVIPGFYYWDGTIWTRVPTAVPLPAASLSSINCNSATHNGALQTCISATGVSSTIAYTGGNGSTYTAQSIASTGVTGLTANLAAGTLSSGNGTLTYTITGTPSTVGTASFEISIGGQTCTLTRAVDYPAASLTSLNCNSATHSGTLYSGEVASGVSSVIPYTSATCGIYSAQSVASTGVFGLTASVAAGTLASGAGTLTYTITGTPSSSGIASFQIILGGQMCTLTRTVTLLGTLNSLDCLNSLSNGVLVSGLQASGVSSNISYTGGNGGVYSAQSIASTGVTGLTANLAAGTLNNGGGSIYFTITGTPTSSGTASFAIDLGGQTCILNRTVNLPEASVSILYCNTATHIGSLQSCVEASGVSSIVSYTGGNGGTYTEQSVTSTGGVLGLTASIAAGVIANGAGTITYTISGTPSNGGIASFTTNLFGKTCSLNIPVYAPEVSLTSINCDTATHNGTLYNNTIAENVSSVISYTGGNCASYTGQSIASTGVTGLTATLIAGNTAMGNGTLTYNITGTPSSSGTEANFAINIGGQTCTLTRTVAIPVASFTYSGSPLHNGTIRRCTNVTDISTILSYTQGNGGTYTTQSIASTGVTGLTASLEGGTLNVGNGTLTITITGYPSGTGTANFTLNIGSKVITFSRSVLTTTVPSIDSFKCADVIHDGILVQGILTSSGVSTVIPYTGGNCSAYSGQTINSTGITGLAAKLVSGSLANGDGTLTFTITGTPSYVGTATFTISLGGQTCTFTRTVNVQLSLASINCAGATYNVDSFKVGTAVSSNVTAIIPYTGANGGSYNSQTLGCGIPGLKAILPAGTTAIGDGTLTYTFTGTPTQAGTATFTAALAGKSCTFSRIVRAVGSISGSLNCGSHTINGVLTSGTVASGVSVVISYTDGNGGYYTQQSIASTGVTGLTANLAEGILSTGSGSVTYTITGTPSADGIASFPITLGGMSCTVVVQVGCCGAYTAPGVYTIFASHNLGADTSLDPKTLVKGIFGDYYQWGKPTPVATVDTPSTTISGYSSSTLAAIGSWSDVTKTANDPCPAGYRLPTKAQFDGLRANNKYVIIGIPSSSETNFGVAACFTSYAINARWLVLPSNGSRRNPDGALQQRGDAGYYWSSNDNGSSTLAYIMRTASTTPGLYDTSKREGSSIRCVKE